MGYDFSLSEIAVKAIFQPIMNFISATISIYLEILPLLEMIFFLGKMNTLPDHMGFLAIGRTSNYLWASIELKFHWSPENDYSGAFVNLGYWF